jgi:hypothetical protein
MSCSKNEIYFQHNSVLGRVTIDAETFMTLLGPVVKTSDDEVKQDYIRAIETASTIDEAEIRMCTMMRIRRFLNLEKVDEFLNPKE